MQTVNPQGDPACFDTRLERTAIMLSVSFENSPLPYLLDCEDFSDRTHRKIFQEIQKNYMEKGTCSFVDLCGKFDGILLVNITRDEQIYWPSVDEDVARVLREFRIKRVAAEFSVSIGEAKSMIDQFTSHTKKLTQLLPRAKRETLDVFNELHETPAPWIPTGFPSVDTRVQMRKTNLVTVGGRTRHGKTSFLINIAVHAMQRKERVDFLSKEMTDRELLPRVVECMTGKRFSEGKEVVDTEVLSRLTIHAISSIQDVASICAKSDASLIFVDYIQRLSSGRGMENRVAELEYITGQLKEIAMTNGKCLVCTSQLGRILDTADRDPVLSDLRGSGSIEQDSDVVLLLYNNLEEEKMGKPSVKNSARKMEGTYDDVTVIIAKNRLGESGRCGLRWEAEVCRFIDQEKPLVEYPLPSL